MDQYVTGAVIKELREKKNMTRAELAEKLQLVKLYPEGNPEAHFKINGVKRIYFSCNRDGLFYIDVNKHIDGRDNRFLNINSNK